MIKPPYTKWINDIKTKLGFTRTMTASGADVVDAVNKQAEQIGNIALPTTAQTLTGAIAENNDQIKTFANKFNPIRGTVTAGPGISIDVQSCYKINNVAYISVYAKATTAISGTANFLVLPWETKARNDFILITPNDTIIRLYTGVGLNLNFNSVNIPANTDIILNVNYIINA